MAERLQSVRQSADIAQDRFKSHAWINRYIRQTHMSILRLGELAFVELRLVEGLEKGMMMSESKRNGWRLALSGLVLALGVGSSTGCQVSVSGQTLPSPYYLLDDVQYFPAGPENKLSNETTALKRAQVEAARARSQQR